MKVLPKKDLVSKKLVAHALSQRNVLVHKVVTESPFIARLRFAFQTYRDLYLVTDYLFGGELSFQLSKQGQFDEGRAKFYLAELVLVVQHLHEQDINLGYIIAENILLDSDGHIVFSDFSLSEIITGKGEQGLDNLSEYMAPEVVLQEPLYTRTSDFWSLGVLAFEMICGWSPFYAGDALEMAKNIAYSKVRFPRDRPSPEGRNFVRALLNRNPKNRLGAASGAEELKCHPFFADIDWIALANKNVTPPPIVKFESHHANYLADTTPIGLSYNESALALLAGTTQSMPLSGSMQANFKGFTFVDEEPLSRHFEMVNGTEDIPREYRTAYSRTSSDEERPPFSDLEHVR